MAGPLSISQTPVKVQGTQSQQETWLEKNPNPSSERRLGGARGNSQSPIIWHGESLCRKVN